MTTQKTNLPTHYEEKEESLGSFLWQITKLFTKCTWYGSKFVVKNAPAAIGMAWEVKKEITKETHHPKIMVATVREYDYDEVSIKIDELINYSYRGKNDLTVSQMKSIVPEFVSNNSQYEKLDIEKMQN